MPTLWKRLPVFLMFTWYIDLRDIAECFSPLSMSGTLWQQPPLFKPKLNCLERKAIRWTRNLEYFLQITQVLLEIVWTVSLEMCAFSNHGFSVYSVQRIGSYQIKNISYFSSGSYQLDLFFCFHCKLLKAKKELSLPYGCEPSCSTLSILNVMISRGMQII